MILRSYEKIYCRVENFKVGIGYFSKGWLNETIHKRVNGFLLCLSLDRIGRIDSLELRVFDLHLGC